MRRKPLTAQVGPGVYNVVDPGSGIVLGVARRVPSTMTGGVAWDAYTFFRGEERVNSRWSRLAKAAKAIGAATSSTRDRQSIWRHHAKE